jgi:Xaa-Pro aminopeptidase
MTELGLSGFLVSHLPNVLYLTGFSGSNGWLLFGESLTLFFTDGRYERQAAEELAGDVDFEVVIKREGVLDELARRADEAFGNRRVGFEGQRLVYGDWERLGEKAQSVDWESAKDIVEALRAVKSDGEIAAIGRAVEIATEALRQTLPLVEPGVRENDISAEIDYRISRLGAEGPAFETIVASGPRSALPHASASERAVKEGDLLLCDFGARWQGYCSDLTRTFVVGEPDTRQEEVYRLVLAARRQALAALQEGASGADVDSASRGVFEREDLASNFPHSTGHGLGLEVHEAPRLSRRADERLQANMVVTVEPGLYFPGWGGVRIEDDVVVTAGEPRVLTGLDRDELLGLPL